MTRPPALSPHAAVTPTGNAAGMDCEQCGQPFGNDDEIVKVPEYGYADPIKGGFGAPSDQLPRRGGGPTQLRLELPRTGSPNTVLTAGRDANRPGHSR